MDKSVPTGSQQASSWALDRLVESGIATNELVGWDLAVSEFWLRLFGVRGPLPSVKISNIRNTTKTKTSSRVEGLTQEYVGSWDPAGM